MFLAGQTPENEPSSLGGGHPVLDTVVALTVGVDVSEIAEDECMAFVSQLAQVRAVFDATETQVLCRMERAQTTVVETGHTTARWLSNETGRPHAATKCRVHVSRKLHDHFDTVQTALGEGRISFAHAKAIVDAANPRILDQLVEIQDQLVKIAEAADRFERFHRELQSIVNLLDQDGAFDPNGETQKNRLAFRFDPDGVRIDGKLVGASAAAVKETLNRIADERFKQQCPDEPALTRPQLLAEALIELCRRGTANGTSGRIPQADITLIIHADDLSTAVTPDGQAIDGSSLNRACCDADITTVTINDDGQPLNVGRTRRLATDAQRRAAMVRDGGCVFPGCDIPTNWCDLHHVTEWQDGGATDLDNLACLCRRHHGLTHSNGWNMQSTGPPGKFAWTTPTGRTLHSQHDPPRPACR